MNLNPDREASEADVYRFYSWVKLTYFAKAC